MVRRAAAATEGRERGMRDHGHDKEDHARTGSEAAPNSRLSRRQVMTASAVVAGVGVASVPAQADAAAGGQAVSLGERGTTAGEVPGRVAPTRSPRHSLTRLGN